MHHPCERDLALRYRLNSIKLPGQDVASAGYLVRIEVLSLPFRFTSGTLSLVCADNPCEKAVTTMAEVAAIFAKL